ncbi:MAG: MarR family transcriptional regulator [Pseudomonadota bacterium]
MAADDRLIYLISKAQHCLKVYLKKAFAAEGLDLTPVQAGILFMLKEAPQSMTQLSRLLAIDNSAITGLVDRLEKVDLAQRRPDPADRRTWLIHITDNGRKEIDRALVIVRRVNSQIKEGFSADEITVFKTVLTRFFDKFSKE